MTTALVGAALWAVATIVAPALLMRGRWWIEHPVAALRAWYAALVVGLAGVALAVGAVLVLLFRERAHAERIEALIVETAVWTCVGVLIALATVTLSVGETAIRRAGRELDAARCLSATADRVEQVDGHDVVVVASDRSFAFSTAARRPQVYVSSALWSRLTEAERRAVVHHEVAHVTGRHAWLLSIARIAHDCTPWLPASRLLERSTTVLVELAADDAACAHVPAGPAAAALRKMGSEACTARALRLERARRVSSTTCSSLPA